MGLFYTNIALRGPTQDQVAQFLMELKREAYVSPTANDITVVYDKECEDQDVSVISNLTSTLSKHFQCPALASLVHDSDVYYYLLYNQGDFIDDYNSIPDYFDDSQPSSPTGGDAKKLCATFNANDVVQDVDELLHPQEDDDDSPLGEDLHQQLVKILGFPPFAADISHDVIEEGEFMTGVDSSMFVKTGR